MKELEILLNRRWVLKSEDKALYYQVRDGLGDIRRFATEKMGCQIVENSLLVKLEKIPAIPEPFMGILDFTSKEEYAFLCVLLMFLEDKDEGEQFILSQLTEYIAGNMPKQSVDWTLYVCRRQLIRVLRYAVSQGILHVTDGSDDVFMEEQSGEVLYENTGASRYFMRNFSKDIMEFDQPEDFQESEWYEMDENRGIVRRHRVYKRLLFTPGLYRESGPEEDFEYLKNYGRRLAEDMEQNFDCQVHLHKGSAYLLMGEDCHMGVEFPGNNAISDILLLCCAKIRQRVEENVWQVRNDETILVDEMEWIQLLREVKAEWGAGFIKQYRELPDGEFVKKIMEHMERWTFLKPLKAEHQMLIYPLAGKLMGQYPEDYVPEHTTEKN